MATYLSYYQQQKKNHKRYKQNTLNPTYNFSTLHEEQKSVNNNFGNKTNLEIKLKSFNFKIQIKDQLKSDNKLQNQKQTHKQTFL